MTVRVNRIEKYWECCKVESECSRDKKGEILLKKAVLAILIAGMAVLTHVVIIRRLRMMTMFTNILIMNIKMRLNFI